MTQSGIRTGDLGGTATTAEFADAVSEAVVKGAA
jgi:hypothetical protein